MNLIYDIWKIMLFNSYQFIFLFLPIMFFGYFYLTSKRLILGSKVWLVGGSLFFYSYWNVIYLPLILLSIFVNYAVGSSFGKEYRVNKKTVLTLGILFNIALLGYFKYTDFFLDNWNGIFGSNIPLPHIILPLGISFFTFTQIAYLVDAYKGEVREYDLLRYMLFVTFFPHLLAGPILHHKEMMPQFASRWNWAIRWRHVAMGLFLFPIGLFKKVVIADTFAVWATNGFDNAEILTFFEAWATSLSYTFQLYFDFSGYTDMAIGASLMFNIKLPINFNSPYKALNIQDFWRRWHITLSRFLRDYVYIPLGGNRNGKYRNYLNLFAVFLIGGLWHGASWMFVIWGAMHGAAIVIHRVWQDLGFRMWKWLAWLITFNFINITWVFFRAKDMESAEKVLSGMVGGRGINIPKALYEKLSFLQNNKIIKINFGSMFDGVGNKYILLYLLATLIFLIYYKNSNELGIRFHPNNQIVLIFSLITAFVLVSINKPTTFLYFNF